MQVCLVVDYFILLCITKDVRSQISMFIFKLRIKKDYNFLFSTDMDRRILEVEIHTIQDIVERVICMDVLLHRRQQEDLQVFLIVTIALRIIRKQRTLLKLINELHKIMLF